MLQALVEVASDGIMGKQVADIIVPGQKLLQLGTVMYMVMLGWVPDFDSIRLVKGCVQRCSSVQDCQGLS